MTSSLDFEGELILDGVMLDKLETLTKKLQKATKKTDKSTILLDAKNEIGENPLFFFLDFILDPQITTGISKAKINKKVLIRDDMPHTFQNICLYLAEHNTGTDEDISMAVSYIYWNASHKDFLMRVFTKNLPLGIEAATVNKIFGKVVIPVWEVQQGYPIDKIKLKPDTWFSLSRKMNGNRGTFYHGKFFSRQGQEFTGLDHIKDDIIKEDVAYWTGEKEYNIVITETGTVILAVEWEYDDNSNLTGLTSGPCWLDENTLGKWGQEGDFKYVDSSEYSDSSSDSTEISAYYIHHWYGEEPYEITDKDTIHKITAWIENAKSVCKDYPYIDGLEYGGADAYGISLEKDESSDAYESICVIDVSQYSWDTSGGMHSENKICNFSIKDDTGEFQDYNLPKEMIDEIMPLITRPNVE